MFNKKNKKPSFYNHKLPSPNLSKWQLFLRSIALIYAAGSILAIGVLIYVLLLFRALPEVEQLNDYKYNLPTIIYDNKQEPVLEYYDQKRSLLTEDQIPQLAKNALVASEDRRFYDHYGIDVLRIMKAFWVNIVNMRIVQGASTLTQQTAKLYFLTPQKTIKRKVSEILLAIKLERNFSKDQILSFYLNKAFFGRQSYGIEAAAKTYFNKQATELSIDQMATLIGLLPAPSRYSPTVNLQSAITRRNIVLKAMLDVGYINQQQYQQAVDTKLQLDIKKTNNKNTSFFTEEVRRYLVNKYGAEEVKKGGLRVYTTLDAKLQNQAQQALNNGLINIGKRHGYKGPLANINFLNEVEIENFEDLIGKNEYELNTTLIGLTTFVNQDLAVISLGEVACGVLKLEKNNWAVPYNLTEITKKDDFLTNLEQAISWGDYLEIKISGPLNNEDNQNLLGIQSDCFSDDKLVFEVELNPTPINNGAILVVDTSSGHVLAMSGGYSFDQSQFNRVTQSFRPSGSAFKPFVYLSALEKNYTPASILDDSPVSFSSDTLNNIWIPKNYSPSFTGFISFRDALVFSKNLPTISLANEIGLSSIRNTAEKLMLDKDSIPDNLSAALGSGSVSLWQMVRAYSIFALNGTLLDPVFILRIENAAGEILEEVKPNFIPEVVSEDSAFIMNTILQDVNKRGTGASAGRTLDVVSAGKTGTTNDNSNAWYIGYIPGLIAGVYVGNDDFQQSLGEKESGGVAALPIWIDFMKQSQYKAQGKSIVMPPSIVKVEITKNGKLYCDNGLEHYSEYFKFNQVPTTCDQQYSPNIVEPINDEELGDSTADEISKEQLEFINQDQL